MKIVINQVCQKEQNISCWNDSYLKNFTPGICFLLSPHPPLGLWDLMTSSYDLGRDRGWDSEHCVWKEIRRKRRKLLLLLRESGLSRHLISVVTERDLYRGSKCIILSFTGPPAHRFYKRKSGHTVYTTFPMQRHVKRTIQSTKGSEDVSWSAKIPHRVQRCQHHLFPLWNAALLQASAAITIFLAMQNLTHAEQELVYYFKENSIQVTWRRKPKEAFNS